MVITLDPNGHHSQVVGAVAALMAKTLGGSTRGYVPYVLWASERTTEEAIKAALMEALCKMRLPAGAVTIQRLD